METNVIIKRKMIERDGVDYFFILEVGTNYIEIAEKLKISVVDAMKKVIDEAALCGADAIKFQTYKAETLAHPVFADKQYGYLKKHEVKKYEDMLPVIKYCEELNICFMTTLFDEEGVEILGDKLPLFKIASPDMTNKPLLKKINDYGKLVILSTAASEINELQMAIKWLGECQVVPMYCVGIYNNSDLSRVNLATLRIIRRSFPHNVIGYSDHSSIEKSLNILRCAYGVGARIFEKHFTLDNALIGNDHEHSFTPKMFREFKEMMNDIKETYGHVGFYIKDGEKDLLRNGRRSLFATKDLEVGHKVIREDLIALRPGTFTSPAEINKILGKTLKKEVKNGSPIYLEDLC